MAPGSIHVLTGYDKGDFLRHAVAASYRVAPGYDPAGAGGADVAVVVLPHPMAAAGITLRVLDGTLAAGTPLVLGGYSQDRAETLLADLSCTVQGYAAGGALLHDCEGTRGTSGAPLLARDEAGSWLVAGVQAAGQTERAGGVAVPASAILDLMQHTAHP